MLIEFKTMNFRWRSSVDGAVGDGAEVVGAVADGAIVVGAVVDGAIVVDAVLCRETAPKSVSAWYKYFAITWWQY